MQSERQGRETEVKKGEELMKRIEQRQSVGDKGQDWIRCKCT